MENLKLLSQEIKNICLKLEPETSPILSKDSLTERDILPLIYLLPLKEKTEKQKKLAAALEFLWLSRECHGLVKEGNSQDNSKYILFGDLFYSHAYKILEDSGESDTLNEISDIVVNYNQAWFDRQAIDDWQSLSREKTEKLIDDDIGLLLTTTARKGAEAAKYNEEERKIYQNCGKALSRIWAKKRYAHNLDPTDFEKSAIDEAAKLNMSQEIAEIIKILK